MKQYAALDDTVYFWFAANDTSGSGGDGASPAADVRLAGAAADAIPVYSPTPVLLTHANYPAGAYEIAITATAANGFAVNNTYAIFCTLAIDAQNPTGFVGSFDLKPIKANVTQLLDTAWLTPGVAGTPDVNAKLLGGTAQTGNDVGADVNSILTDTAEIGTAGAGLTDLGGMATGMKAEIESECNDALVALKLDHLIAVADADDVVDSSIIAKLASKGATPNWSTFVNTTDALEAIRDRGDAAWTTGAGGSDHLLMVDTTIATLASQTSFTLTAGSADDDAYNNATIVIEDASTATQKAMGLISNYVGSTKTVTLKYDPGIFTMAATDKVYILAENALKATLANRQLNVAADGGIAGNVDGAVASVTADVGITQAGADKVRASVCVTGDPANSIGKVLYEIYINRLTSTRAGYIDNLSAGAVALASGVDLTKIHGVALTETVNGYLATAFVKLFDVATPLLVASTVMRGTDSAALAASYTATRAGYLDNINNANLANVPNLTSLTREQLGFSDGFVYFDASSGSAGTAFPIGTSTSPSSNVANTKTIADNNNLAHIHVHGAFQLGEAWEHYTFTGHLHEILANMFDLNGQDVDGSNLNNLFVSGAQGGTGDLVLNHCFLYQVTNFNGIACCCDLYGSAMSIKDTGSVDLTDCNAIHSTLTLTLNAPTRFSLKGGKGNCTLTGQDGGTAFVRGFDGTLIIASMTGGTLSIYGDSGTDVTINATCTAGTINIYGDCNVTDSSGAGCTVNDYSLSTVLSAMKGSGFSTGTDSLEAIRDRGDAAWITGAGGGITDILQVVPSIPTNIDLADTKTVRIALYLLNSLDDLPSTAEITPGTITIERSADGGTSWSVIVNAAACTEQAGQIYYDEVFDSGTGYASGDMIRITFKSQKITVAANDYEITDVTHGWMFHTRIDGGGAGASAASIADAVWDELSTGHTGAGKAGQQLWTDVDAILTDTGTTLDALIKRVLGLTQENHYIDNTTFTTGKLTAARIRIYSVAGSVGSASDVIATYNIAITYDANGNMETYKVTKA